MDNYKKNGDSKHRNKYDIYATMIEKANSGAKKTDLMTGMSFYQLQKYLEDAINLGLIEIILSEGGTSKLFRATERGLKYLESHKQTASYLQLPTKNQPQFISNGNGAGVKHTIVRPYS